MDIRLHCTELMLRCALEFKAGMSLLDVWDGFYNSLDIESKATTSLLLLSTRNTDSKGPLYTFLCATGRALHNVRLKW